MRRRTVLRFMRRASGLTVIGLVAACGRQPGYEPQLAGDVERGRAAIAHFECGACHVVPGVAGPRGQVGPALGGFRDSVYIAGRFPNTPDMLARWVREAPAMAPESAMPEFDMTDAQARDVVAYLYSLR